MLLFPRSIFGFFELERLNEKPSIFVTLLTFCVTVKLLRLRRGGGDSNKGPGNQPRRFSFGKKPYLIITRIMIEFDALIMIR